MNFPTSKASAAASPAAANEPAAANSANRPAAPSSGALAQASILIVDDEPGMRNFLVRTLGPRCKHVEEAADTDEALAPARQEPIRRRHPRQHHAGQNGVDWLAEQRAVGFFAATPSSSTAFADLDTAIQALRAGAVDFVAEAVPLEPDIERGGALSRPGPVAARELCAALCAARFIRSHVPARQSDRDVTRDPQRAGDHCPRRPPADIDPADRRFRHRQGSRCALGFIRCPIAPTSPLCR